MLKKKIKTAKERIESSAMQGKEMVWFGSKDRKWIPSAVKRSKTKVIAKEVLPEYIRAVHTHASGKVAHFPSTKDVLAFMQWVYHTNMKDFHLSIVHKKEEIGRIHLHATKDFVKAVKENNETIKKTGGALYFFAKEDIGYTYFAKMAIEDLKKAGLVVRIQPMKGYKYEYDKYRFKKV